MHAVGAIGYLAGIGMYVAWQRSLQGGHDNPKVLANAAGVTYISILVNLLGGFIRTYQPGHPPLVAFFDEAWVALMTIKHVALFAGIIAAAYIFEVAAPRLRRHAKQGRPLATKGADVAAGSVMATILIASILGGITTVVPIGDAAPIAGPPGGVAVVPYTGATHWFNGTITSGGNPDTGTFPVPDGATGIDAVLTVAGQAVDPSQVTLILVDPTGAQRTDTTTGTSGPKTASLSYDEPRIGTWEWRVQGDVAVQSTWSLRIDVPGVPLTVVEETVFLRAGEWLEVDTEAAAGIEYAWSWSVDNSEVDWDIHTHAHGAEVIRSGRGAAGDGTYITPQATDLSFFWEARGDVTLSIRIEGHFQVTGIVKG